MSWRRRFKTWRLRRQIEREMRRTAQATFTDATELPVVSIPPTSTGDTGVVSPVWARPARGMWHFSVNGDLTRCGRQILPSWVTVGAPPLGVCCAVCQRGQRTGA